MSENISLVVQFKNPMFILIMTDKYYKYTSCFHLILSSAYALKTFMMDGKAAIAAINAKIGTMVRAFKKMESDST